jgi:hypothetical protein
MAGKIFINYRREDSAASALGIGQYLEHEFGRKNVFIDIDMRAGVKFSTVLEERLAECKVMLVLIGPSWLNSHDEQGHRRLDNSDDWVRLEIAHASKRNLTVIPIRINGAELPVRAALPEDVRGLLDHQAASVTVSGFRHEMSGLVRDIRSIPRPRTWRRFGVPAAGILSILLMVLVLAQALRPATLAHIRLLLSSHKPVSTSQNGIWTSLAGEWVLFAVDNNNNPMPYYFQPSSLKISGDVVAYMARFLLRSASSPASTETTLPQAAYEDDRTVLDCRKSISAIMERTVYSKSGEIISHFKFQDAESMDVSAGQPIGSGSILAIGKNIVCNEQLRSPVLTKEQVSNLKLSYLSPTPNGDGDIFYGQPKKISDSGYEFELLTVLRFYVDHELSEVFPGKNVPGLPPRYRSFAQSIQLSCAERRIRSPKLDNFDSEGNIVYVNAPLVVEPIEPKEGSPFAQLLTMTCGAPVPSVGGIYEGVNKSTQKIGGQGEQRISIVVEQIGSELKVTFQTGLGEQGKGKGTLAGSRVHSMSLQSATTGCPASYDASLEFAGDTVSWSFKGQDCNGPMEGNGTANRKKS